MKYENFLLRGLFVLCMVLCVATVGSMLFPGKIPQASTLTEARISGSQTSASAITPIACPLLDDGVLCVRQD
jgi:hypothetical protein